MNRWRRLHGSLFKCRPIPWLHCRDAQLIDDRQVSWFRYEELVNDWVTFTTIEASERGPLLKSRRIGDAHMYNRRTFCKILKNTLKKFFLKGSTNVYLYRFLTFFNHRRQHTKFLIFASKFEILLSTHLKCDKITRKAFKRFQYPVQDVHWSILLEWQE